MLPQWAYGLFQSKDHYGSQAELQGVADSYRANNIPLDTIFQDWQVWGKKAEAASEIEPGQLCVFEGRIAKVKKGEGQWETVISGFEVVPITAPVAGMYMTT